MAGREPSPALLVVGFLASDDAARGEALRALAGRLGPVALWSRPLAFSGRAYYADEMGPGLTRRWAAFGRLVGQDRLAAVKRHCLALEDGLAREGRRRVNIDPGLMTAGVLILATTKYQPHRLPLAAGLYQEISLWWESGAWQALPWTYPDLAGEQTREVLAGFRRRYLWQLKGEDKEA